MACCDSENKDSKSEGCCKDSQSESHCCSKHKCLKFAAIAAAVVGVLLVVRHLFKKKS